MKKVIKKLSDFFMTPLMNRYFSEKASRADLDNLFVQISSLMQIRDILDRCDALGTLRGWAISPDALLTLLRDIQQRENPYVVEFGAGESTIAIAALLKKRGFKGRLKTFEHDADFAARLRSRLETAGLSEFADIKPVSLRQYPSMLGFDEFVSYDLDGVEEDFDVALVDGPIVPNDRAATRIIPLAWCIQRLSTGRLAYLDDANRSSERQIIKALQAETKGVEFELLRSEKGLMAISSVTDAVLTSDQLVSAIGNSRPEQHLALNRVG